MTSQDWSPSASAQWGGKEECHWMLTGPFGASCVLPRCVQGLQQGLLVWRQEVPSEFDLAYADFLSLDISMLRLFETFLETTPQLTLVLAIILQSGSTEYYQCECWAQGQPPPCRTFTPWESCPRMSERFSLFRKCCLENRGMSFSEAGLGSNPKSCSSLEFGQRGLYLSELLFLSVKWT